MSAAPQYLGLPMQPREPRKSDAPVDDGTDDRRLQSFWHWFAVCVLLFCWMKERPICSCCLAVIA